MSFVSIGGFPDIKNLDAFARLRVANPETIFDSKQISDNQSLFWDDQEVSGTGTGSTYNTNQASTTMSVGAAAGKRVRQTFRWFNYQSGKSQLILLTGVIGTSSAGITKRLGQFNDDNGYMFISAPSGFAVGLRSKTSGSTVDTIVPQDSWNLDKLDGTGLSKKALDPTKTNIFFIDYQWLGVGAARFGFVIDGSPIYVHQFNNANNLEVVYTSSPNLPLRYEIENDGTGAASSMTHICTSVITEGGRANTGAIKGINRGVDSLTTNSNDSIYPLIGLRLKTPYFGALIRYIDHQVVCNSTSEYAWYILLNPTIVGTAPTWIDLSNSAIQYAFTTNATTLTGGTLLATGLGSDTNQSRQAIQALVESDLAIGSNISGTPDEIYLSVQRLTGTTETFYSCLNFSETI